MTAEGASACVRVREDDAMARKLGILSQRCIYKRSDSQERHGHEDEERGKEVEEKVAGMTIQVCHKVECQVHRHDGQNLPGQVVNDGGESIRRGVVAEGSA